ncbi:MAG: VCBS domain-containing protein [Halofilum sp. (in: g-proteobacteria)]|nr:VCBS domain-containing protein [Halofilum sp. (in: g-proteobacteria)]
MTGSHGTVTINSDGGYTYDLDDAFGGGAGYSAHGRDA